MTEVVPRQFVGDARRRIRNRAKDYWHKFPSLMLFLEHHRPYEWAAIQRCVEAHKTYLEDETDLVKVVPIRCEKVPWCIWCVQHRTWRRLNDALDMFSECTPAGKEPRFYHIVQTAPIYDDWDSTTRTGTGWGVPASQNLREFKRIVWESLQELYGDGIGAYLSYQDFGEQSFKKRHPHIDLTLNGWRILDGKAMPLPEYEVRNGGLERWNNTIRQAAQALWPDAKNGNVRLKRVRVGFGEYAPVLRYQIRELVDLRKLEYNRFLDTVTWQGYESAHRPAQRVVFTVDEFFDGMQEYQDRLGAWRKGARQALHTRYGHMADRTRSKTAAQIGGQPRAHRENCPCMECGRPWYRVFLDDDGNERGHLRGLMPPN